MPRHDVQHQPAELGSGILRVVPPGRKQEEVQQPDLVHGWDSIEKCKPFFLLEFNVLLKM